MRGLLSVLLVLGLMSACAPLPVVQGAAESGDRGHALRRAAIHTELGGAYLQRGQASVALQEAQAALRAKADHVPALVLEALAYMALDQSASAKRSLDAALTLAPHDPYALLNRAWWHCAKADYEQALNGFELARVAGVGSDAWLGTAVCTARAGREAGAAFARAAQLAPNDVRLTVAWAQYASEAGRWARVHELLEPINAGPRVSQRSLQLQAMAYQAQGQADVARQLMQRAQDISPESPPVASMQQELWHD